MRKRFASVLLAATALLAGAAHAASIDKHPTVQLDRDAIVGGAVVPAGTYRLELATGRDTAKFVQGKRTVAEAPCKVGLAEADYPGTAVHYRTAEGGRDRLVKITFAGSHLAVEFPIELAGPAATAGPDGARLQ